MLTVFFNKKESAIVNLLPQGTPFAAAHFVGNAIIALAKRHAQQQSDILRPKLYFDNDKCHAAWHTGGSIKSGLDPPVQFQMPQILPSNR
jgi:hypothetical protein